RSSTGLKDWKAAKRVEAFNRESLERGLRPDDFVRSRKVWVPWHEISCEENIQDPPPSKRNARHKAVPAEPATGKDKRHFPIFGPKYAKTPLLSQRLKGRAYYLVSGHAGPDPGAQGKRAGHTLCEDEYAYDVTLRLLRLLLSHGATAYMIVRDPNDGIRDDAYLVCDKDEVVWGDLSIPVPQRERLQQRSELINQMTEQNIKAGIAEQTLVEIHVDSRSSDTETDVFFYYRPGSEPSKRLAQRIHRTFEQKYRSKQSQREYKGTVTERGLFMLTETLTMKAVYVELANIQNDWDQQRLVIANNRQALANWLCTALLAD
ncbi:MAG TPA: N-acetylmuramoyl-L-alanine amidase, partial [Saprospiraceae bacterium]|nr:N-acetylmuramoyl-L-alanine amidase [Saprospiraceae bacterium]